MKKQVYSTFACLVLAFSQLTSAATGLELMQEQKRLHDVATEYSESEMTLIDRKGRKRVRELINYSKKKSAGEARSLLKFTEPRDINNVGLLTWQHSTDIEDEQWLYLPASKRIKRIAGGGKKNPFMGSDLAFEDLRPEDLSAHTYELLGEEIVDGEVCWKVEVLPSTTREAKESGYGRRLIWLRKDINYPVKIEFFNRRNKLAKTAVYQELEQVKGTVWRYKLLSMITHKKKTSTLMRIQAREIDIEIDDKQFNQQILRRPAR
jgi:hypothetical protein